MARRWRYRTSENVCKPRQTSTSSSVIRVWFDPLCLVSASSSATARIRSKESRRHFCRFKNDVSLRKQSLFESSRGSCTHAFYLDASREGQRKTLACETSRSRKYRERSTGFGFRESSWIATGPLILDRWMGIASGAHEGKKERECGSGSIEWQRSDRVILGERDGNDMREKIAEKEMSERSVRPSDRPTAVHCHGWFCSKQPSKGGIFTLGASRVRTGCELVAS